MPGDSNDEDDDGADEDNDNGDEVVNLILDCQSVVIFYYWVGRRKTRGWITSNTR